jgi:hypothetical protein
MKLFLFFLWTLIMFGVGYFGHKYQTWIIEKIKNIKLGKG